MCCSRLAGFCLSETSGVSARAGCGQWHQRTQAQESACIRNKQEEGVSTQTLFLGRKDAALTDVFCHWQVALTACFLLLTVLLILHDVCR